MQPGDCAVGGLALRNPWKPDRFRAQALRLMKSSALYPDGEEPVAVGGVVGTARSGAQVCRWPKT
jgi:hypothetical protein